MSLSKKLIAAMIPQQWKQALLGDVEHNVASTGTTQSTAYRITADSTFFSVVPNLSGAILPLLAQESDLVEISNAAINVLRVYPALDESINALPANVPFLLESGRTVRLRKVSNTVWRVVAASNKNQILLPLDTTQEWASEVAGTGVATINTSQRYFEATLLANNDTANYSISIDSLSSLIDATALEIKTRFEILGGSAGTRAIVALRSSTSTDSLNINAWGTGQFERGSFIAGSWASGGFSSSNAVQVDGTGWLRFRLRGSLFETAFGAGSLTSEPTRWKMMQTNNIGYVSDGTMSFDRIELAGGQYDAPAGTVKVRFYDTYVSEL